MGCSEQSLIVLEYPDFYNEDWGNSRILCAETECGAILEQNGRYCSDS